MSFLHSIKFRFTVWYLLVLIILLSILSTVVYFHMSRSLNNNLDNSLELRATQLQSIRTILDSIKQGEFQQELGEIVVLYYYSGDTLVQVSSRNISVTLDSQFVERAIDGESSFVTVHTTTGEEVRLYAAPIRLPGPGGGTGVQQAAVVVGRSTKDIEQALDGLVRTLSIAVPLTLLVAAGGGVFLARRALKPVDQISQTAQDIGGGDLSQRIEVNTRDELGRLASTLNQMIGRLQRAFKRQQQFTADASHELRTPLAVIQAESSLALQKDRSASDYQKSLESVSQEANHMSAIIDRLLTLARADDGKDRLTFQEVNLAKLIQDLGADAEILCQEKGLRFHLGEAHDLIVKGDEAMLRQLFLNLLDNATKYTPSGGTVSVSFRTEGQMAVVAVSDTGIGIAPEDMPFIFERFYRVDKARSRAGGGAGLGLAISQHIAKAHGGKIEVESQLGKGSTFTVSLPRLKQA
ncbi:MAG: HAMP domain-containing protein [Chloroflexi bacterium]|nr:HAMP domain-containing protein [Chloroflexota bacterium]